MFKNLQEKSSVFELDMGEWRRGYLEERRMLKSKSSKMSVGEIGRGSDRMTMSSKGVPHDAACLVYIARDGAEMRCIWLSKRGSPCKSIIKASLIEEKKVR